MFIQISQVVKMKTDKYVDGDVCEALTLLRWAVEKYVLPMEVLKEEIKIKKQTVNTPSVIKNTWIKKVRSDYMNFILLV